MRTVASEDAEGGSKNEYLMIWHRLWLTFLPHRSFISLWEFKKKNWAGNMLLSTRYGIITLLLGGNVMVSWSHFVKDKCSLIDKVISVFPRDNAIPALGRNFHPQNCHAEAFLQ